jgi:hypothetical protein
MGLQTPVAFFVFNRPEPTRRVFSEIAKARPRTLLIVADGPRERRDGEAERCAEVRRIVEAVDWECTVLRNYAPANLGCRRRVSSGLDWVFAQCEEAIILEDDCLPDASFFPFCEELLGRYRHDERVMMISGDNFQEGRATSVFSYYFSGYAHVWGWASWRRAWNLYDVDMALWPVVRDGLFRDLGDGVSEAYWREVFDRTASGEIDTWDYQWLFACAAQNGLTILPEANLISNIGFGAGATHTHQPNRLAGLATSPMSFPLRHPPYVIRDRHADRFTFERVFQPPRPRLAGVRARVAGVLNRFPGRRVPPADTLNAPL